MRVVTALCARSANYKDNNSATIDSLVLVVYCAKNDKLILLHIIVTVFDNLIFNTKAMNI